MNPERVWAESYRSYEQLDLALPTGAFAVTGANGAGKSSILLLIDLCLFGGRDLSRYMNRTRGEVMEIGLDVEHRGVLYRIRRTYNPAGRGKTTLDFERHVGDVELHVDQQEAPVGAVADWEPLTEGNARDTQQRIEQTFGLSRETFRASAYLAQGDSAAFTEADAADRKRILADVLGLGVWDEMLELARRDRGIAQEQIAKTRATQELRDELLTAMIAAEAQRRVSLDEFTRMHARADPLHAEMVSAHAAVEEARAVEEKRVSAVAAVSVADQRLASEQRAYADLVEVRDRAAAELERVEAARPAAARIAELEADAAVFAVKRQEWLAAEQRRAAADQQLARARGELGVISKQLDDAQVVVNETTTQLQAPIVGVCGTCGQPLDDAEARERFALSVKDVQLVAEAAVVTLTRRAQEAEAATWQLVKQLAELPTEAPSGPDFGGDLALAREAAAIVAGEPLHDQRRAKADALIAEASAAFDAAERAAAEAHEALDALGEAPPLPALRDRLRAAEAAWEIADRELGDLRARHEREQGRCDEISERLEAVGDPAADHAAAAAEAGILDQLVEAYGRNGVPALIIETSAIPHLEAEANRILADLGTSMLVELRTQRALKTGAGVRETLDIIVKMDGAESLYEDLSGGERSRMNVSLRIALARLLAHRRGSDVRMLVLDEPEYLDDAGTEQLAAVLHGLAGDFERVALVSHVTGLRDAFDTVISVERDEGGASRIVA